jgi:hypothetical protein
MAAMEYDPANVCSSCGHQFITGHVTPLLPNQVYLGPIRGGHPADVRLCVTCRKRGVQEKPMAVPYWKTRCLRCDKSEQFVDNNPQNKGWLDLMHLNFPEPKETTGKIPTWLCPECVERIYKADYERAIKAGAKPPWPKPPDPVPPNPDKATLSAAAEVQKDFERMSEGSMQVLPQGASLTPIRAANKYLRKVRGWSSGPNSNGNCLVDVYVVLRAYGVTHPAVAQAVKKLLCPGQRDKGNALQDLVEARQALDRAIEDEERDKADGRVDPITAAKEKWFRAAGLKRPEQEDKPVETRPGH